MSRPGGPIQGTKYRRGLTGLGGLLAALQSRLLFPLPVLHYS